MRRVIGVALVMVSVACDPPRSTAGLAIPGTDGSTPELEPGEIEPFSYCLDEAFAEVWAPSLVRAGLDRWDDLIPDQDLFVYDGLCSEPLASDIGFAFSEQPSAFYTHSRPSGDVFWFRIGSDLPVRSVTLEPDLECRLSDFYWFEALVARGAGIGMGLGIFPGGAGGIFNGNDVTISWEGIMGFDFYYCRDPQADAVDIQLLENLLDIEIDG
ncbi:MAG: hypothetical protein AAF211_20495 [Myxococcota bacterium]